MLEIFQFELFPEISIPLLAPDAKKKSEILFPVTEFPLLSIVAFDPDEKIQFCGRFEPAAEMLLLEIILLSFPDAVPVEKKMTPAIVLTVEPVTVQFVTVLFFASRINLIALDTPNAVFEIVNEFPPVINPSIVTLSAPLRLIKCPTKAPDIVLEAPPDGLIEIEV